MSQTDNAQIRQASEWFEHHVTLFGQPYTLDDDQVRAAIDAHQNTLVTARAGSGKTRVIVAKVAYLVAHGLAHLDEIAIFMFNRTATAEVNQRIAAVAVDGHKLADTCHVASTFHKFALDIAKLAGAHPQIISSKAQSELIQTLLQRTLTNLHYKLTPAERQEMFGLVQNFITRAGQYYPGYDNLKVLEAKVAAYCQAHATQPEFAKFIRIHQISLEVYRQYLANLHSPKIDFNLLMHQATQILQHSSANSSILRERIAPLKYILVDEYQDFSYLFYALVQAIRQQAPAAKLFCVGDDWQAINRFAGSNVDYFVNFAHYFPEDVANIPLATNYRSARRIVEQANHFMLTHYDPAATPARAFSRQRGKIYHLNPQRVRFDVSDLQEDGLGDGQILLALSQVSAGQLSPDQIPLGAAKLLKAVFKIVRRHPHEDIMLLHRHNFTSFAGVNLDTFQQALGRIVIRRGIMNADDFARQIRCFTMHRSKGLESNIVILLELNQEIVQNQHPHATIFELFGDTRAAEIADQQRLLYVALTRAKQKLYLLSTDAKPLV